MAHFGMFCFLGRGHLDPLAALGRQLLSRSHRVTVFHLMVARAAVKAAGLEFSPIDEHESLRMSRKMPRSWANPFGAATTVNAVEAQAQRVLREGPEALRGRAIDMVIADQMDVAAGTVAEALNIPFVNVSCGPPVYLDKMAPAPYFGWRHASGALAKLRNRAGNSIINHNLAPVLKVLNQGRRSLGLSEIRHLNDVFSRIAIITQLPEALEFKRPAAPGHLFYTGQFVDGWARKAVIFPWEKLNGKRLIYASMGTIRNNVPWVFRTIAEACASFDCQLVLSLGAGTIRPEDLGLLPGHPIVVEYAPQIELIRLSSLVINCAGLNTTLDCVSSGVPIVAIPVAEDQPGIAARIQLTQMGIVIPVQRLSVARLRRAVQRVLEEPQYAAAVRRLQSTVRSVNGPAKAADIIELALERKAPLFQTA